MVFTEDSTALKIFDEGRSKTEQFLASAGASFTPISGMALQNMHFSLMNCIASAQERTLLFTTFA